MNPFTFSSVLQDSSIEDNYSLDDPQRAKWNRSLWNKIIHYKEKSLLDEKVVYQVQSFFSERYHFNDEVAFQRIWKELGAKVWDGKNTLTAKILRSIEEKFNKDLIYHGEGVHPPPSPLEDKSVPKTNNTVQKVVQALLHGGSFSPLSLEKKAAKAIFVTHDKKMMEEFRQRLQAEMDHLAENPPKDKAEEIVWRAFLGNVISLLPFCYPKDGALFTIPILDGDQCRKVVYQIEIIPLKYHSFSSPMPCLALTPQDDPSAPPIMAFIGTTFPAGKGFIATLLADFTPGHSVGEIIHKRNKEKIEKWLKDKKNVHVVGMSLGGAMAFHALRHHPQITQADVYNPPGLYSGNWKKKIESDCKVNIYCQPGDVVSKLGTWPTGDNTSLYTVYAHQKGVSEDPLSAHARAFTGCEKVTVVKEDPAQENRSWKRYLLTKLHQFFGPFAVYLPVTCGLMGYHLARSVHRAAKYCFKKIIKH